MSSRSAASASRWTLAGARRGAAAVGLKKGMSAHCGTRWRTQRAVAARSPPAAADRARTRPGRRPGSAVATRPHCVHPSFPSGAAVRRHRSSRASSRSRCRPGPPRRTRSICPPTAARAGSARPRGGVSRACSRLAKACTFRCSGQRVELQHVGRIEVAVGNLSAGAADRQVVDRRSGSPAGRGTNSSPDGALRAYRCQREPLHQLGGCGLAGCGLAGSPASCG